MITLGRARTGNDGLISVRANRFGVFSDDFDSPDKLDDGEMVLVMWLGSVKLLGIRGFQQNFNMTITQFERSNVRLENGTKLSSFWKNVGKENDFGNATRKRENRTMNWVDSFSDLEDSFSLDWGKLETVRAISVASQRFDGIRGGVARLNTTEMMFENGSVFGLSLSSGSDDVSLLDIAIELPNWTDEIAIGQMEEEISYTGNTDDDSASAKVEKEGGLSESAMYGIIAGGIALCLILMIGIGLWIWRKRRGARKQKRVESDESESVLVTMDERRKSVGTLPSTHAGSDFDSQRNGYARAPTNTTNGLGEYGAMPSSAYAPMPNNGYEAMPSDGYAAMPSEAKTNMQAENAYSAMPMQPEAMSENSLTKEPVTNGYQEIPKQSTDGSELSEYQKGDLVFGEEKE